MTLMKRGVCHTFKPQVLAGECTQRSGVFYRASDCALTGSNGSAWGAGHRASVGRRWRRLVRESLEHGDDGQEVWPGSLRALTL